MKSFPILKEKWQLILQQRYPNLPSELITAGVKKLEDIVTNFICDGLADKNFEEQLASKNDYRYHQRMSEALLYDRLKREGFILSTPRNGGPDLKGVKNGITTWFELITPEPTTSILDDNNNVASRLTPCPEKANKNYHDLLLKITSSIQEKNQKFIGYKKPQKAKKKNSPDKPPIVAENDVCIIVINDGLLHPQDISCAGLNYELLHGASGLPLAIEALYGVGSSYWNNQVSIPHLLRTHREKINNRNNSPISVDQFLTNNMGNISSIMSLTLREDYGLADIIYKDHNLGLLVINENAQQKTPQTLIKCPIFSKKEEMTLKTPNPNGVSLFNTITTISGYRIKFFNDLLKFRDNKILEFLNKKLTEHIDYVPSMNIAGLAILDDGGIQLTISHDHQFPQDKIDQICDGLVKSLNEFKLF